MFLLDVLHSTFNVFFLKINAIPVDFHRYIPITLLIIHLVKNGVEIYFVLKIVMDWAGEVYSFNIDDKHLIKREGIFTIREKIYDLKNIRSLVSHQSFFGKLFHYGDITIETSAPGGYKDKIFLSGIGNPQKYEKILQQLFK